MVHAHIRTPDSRLRVFISSTLQELAPERTAARKAIARLRLSPVAFESGARPHPPKDLYRSYLEQSDIFIGIYWERYGWVAPGMDVSGLEDEFRLATSHPKLIYVKSPAPKRDPKLAQLLERIQREDNVSYKHFSSARELQEAIENDLALMLTERFAAQQRDVPATADPAKVAARHDLPSHLTRFFGREREVAQLRQVLADPGTRLVTLVGPGGVGKSRLALEAARGMEWQFPGGIAFVPLAPVSDPAAIVQAIARALDVREAGSAPLIEAIVEQSRGDPLLLILDNFEHLVDGAGDVSELLSRVPEMTALVTSRETLELQGEQRISVAPLPVDDDAGPSPSIALFADRARAVDATFELSDGNVAAVTEICRRLDGLPLAIELAAARVSMLSPAAILERLGDAITLGRGSRDLPERQRTMRSAVDWSYQLLPDDQRRLLALLSVFPGHITPESASAVCGIAGEMESLEALDSLARKSMLEREPAGRSAQFRMLNAIRGYGLERLEESGDAEGARARHTSYFVELVEQAQPQLFSPHHLTWRDLLDSEYENVRATLAACERDAASMATLIYNLLMFWYRRGWLSEGRHWSDGALETSNARGHDRGMILIGAGSMAMWQGDLEIARSRYEEASTLLVDSPDVHVRGVSQFILGVVMVAQGDVAEAFVRMQNALAILSTSTATRDRYFAALSLMHMGNIGMGLGRTPEAVAWLNASLDASRNVGDGWLIASVLNNLGEAARAESEYERAATHYQEALAQFEQADDRGDAARLLCSLAFVACRVGELTNARSLLDRALGLHDESGSKRGIAECLLGYARVASELAKAAGDAAERRRLARSAAVLLGASDARMASQGATLWPADLPERDAVLDAVRGTLDEAALAEAMSDGASLTLEDVRALV